jgi:hypothetical protein
MAADVNAADLVRRRHVLYVEGYDPQGAEGYHNLFSRSFRRFLKYWPLKSTVSDLHIDNDDLAHWTIEAAAPNWQVSTHYDFLRQEQMIRANMAEPLWRQIRRSLYLTLNFLFTGTLFRIYRASHQYGLALTSFQMLVVWWLVLPGLAGWLGGWLVAAKLGAPVVAGCAVGAAIALAVFRLLVPLANRLMTLQINSHWPYLLEYARDQRPSCWDRCIEVGARRLVEVAKANEADEIVVVGHSGGGVTAPAVVARALELDPDLGRHGPRVVLLTPGSLMPGIGLHRAAKRVHRDIARIAAEPSVLWIDVQARADVLNFFQFDPVSGIGVDVGDKRCNPLIWIIRIRDMVQPGFYDKLRWNLFRMHYQFIMANDLRAPYDYMMLMCGPLPVEQWARGERTTLDRFADDGSYRTT